MSTFSTKTGPRYDDLLPTIDLIYEWMDPAAGTRISSEILELQCTQVLPACISKSLDEKKNILHIAGKCYLHKQQSELIMIVVSSALEL